MEPRVWLHLRKSRHLGDPDDPALLEIHRAILARLAKGDGVEIPASHVIQEVESGEFLAQRGEFVAFLREVESLPEGAGGVLYTMAFDRLSRGDELEQARVRYALRRAGVLIRTPGGVLDLSDPDQSLLAGVRGELARHELARWKWRTEQTRAEKNRRGIPQNGMVPFGYLWDKNREAPVPHPERFPILAACCREIHAASVKRLARKYRISASNLQRALHSPVICGYAARRYHKVTDAAGRRISACRPRAEWVWAETPGAWEPACSRAEWERIQEVLRARYTKPEHTNKDDGWCRDVLRFEGVPAGSWVRMQSGGTRPCYAPADPVTKRSLGYIRRDHVHEHVTAALARVLSRPQPLARALAQQEQARAQPAPAPGEEAAVRERLQVARTRRRRLLEELLAVEDDETREDLLDLRRQIEGEIRTAKRELDRLQSAPAPVDLAPLLAELAGLTEDFPAAWAAASGPLKRQIVNALVAAVPVRIVRRPRGQPQRELLPVVWQEWVRPLAGDQSG